MCLTKPGSGFHCSKEAQIRLCPNCVYKLKTRHIIKEELQGRNNGGNTTDTFREQRKGNKLHFCHEGKFLGGNDM